MASNPMVPKRHFSQTDKQISTISSNGHDEDDFQVDIQEEEEEDNQISRGVTSHIYLKPPHSTGPMNKDVVLRRIRHRKQVNKFKAATQSLLGFPFKFSKNDNTNKVTDPQMIRWVDDAFAAP